jgi:hypothetical protein
MIYDFVLLFLRFKRNYYENYTFSYYCWNYELGRLG